MGVDTIEAVLWRISEWVDQKECGTQTKVTRQSTSKICYRSENILMRILDGGLMRLEFKRLREVEGFKLRRCAGGP
jgi:hypothetical protein